MLQRRIVKDLGNQIDTKNPLYTKYAIIGFSFHSLDYHICQCYHIEECCSTTEDMKIIIA